VCERIPARLLTICRLSVRSAARLNGHKMENRLRWLGQPSRLPFPPPPGSNRGSALPACSRFSSIRRVSVRPRPPPGRRRAPAASMRLAGASRATNPARRGADGRVCEYPPFWIDNFCAVAARPARRAQHAEPQSGRGRLTVILAFLPGPANEGLPFNASVISAAYTAFPGLPGEAPPHFFRPRRKRVPNLVCFYARVPPGGKPLLVSPGPPPARQCPPSCRLIFAICGFSCRPLRAGFQNTDREGPKFRPRQETVGRRAVFPRRAHQPTSASSGKPA